MARSWSSDGQGPRVREFEMRVHFQIEFSDTRPAQGAGLAFPPSVFRKRGSRTGVPWARRPVKGHRQRMLAYGDGDLLTGGRRSDRLSFCLVASEWRFTRVIASLRLCVFAFEPENRMAHDPLSTPFAPSCLLCVSVSLWFSSCPDFVS